MFATIMKQYVFKGYVFENNVRVAQLSVSTYLSWWIDNFSEIDSL